MVFVLSVFPVILHQRIYDFIVSVKTENKGPVAVALLEVPEKVSISALQTLGKVSNMRYNILGKCTESRWRC
jgi:hypothetical protein